MAGAYIADIEMDIEPRNTEVSKKALSHWALEKILEKEVRSENVSTSSHDGQVGRCYAWRLSAKEAPWIGTIWTLNALL